MDTEHSKVLNPTPSKNQDGKASSSSEYNFPKGLRKVFRTKHDYGMSAIWWWAILGTAATLWFCRTIRPISAVWIWLATLPEWLPVSATILLCIAYVRILSPRYGFVPTLMGPSYGVVWLLGRILSILVGGTHFAVSRLVRFLRAVDKIIISWWFAPPAALLYFATVIYALSCTCSAGAAKVLLGVMCIGTLYTTRIFGAWVVDPLRPFRRIWRMYYGLVRDQTSLGDENKIVPADKNEANYWKAFADITDKIRSFIEPSRSRNAIAGLFTGILLFVLSVTVLAFAATYKCLFLMNPKSFAISPGHPAMNSAIDYVYFSVITLFTVGYGDIVPVAVWSRATVIAEIVLGMSLLVLAVSSFASVGIISFEAGIEQIREESSDILKHLKWEDSLPNVEPTALEAIPPDDITAH